MGKSLDALKNEDDILEAFNVLREEGEESARPRWRQMRKNAMVYMGDHYVREQDDELISDDKVPGYRFRISRDLIGPVIETLRPILMRGYPKYYLDADFPFMQATIDTELGEVPIPNTTDGELAQRLQDILANDHDHRNEGIQIAELLVDVLVGGTAYRKVVYDPVLNRVNLPILHPENVIPDPYGTAIDFSDSKYVIVKTDIDAADIERIYRVKEKDYAGDDQGEYGASGLMGAVSKVTRYLKPQAGGTLEKDTKYERRRYPVYELYYHEATPESTMQPDKPPKSLKYPNGRMMTIVNGRKIVVDRANPYWHREFPIVCYQANPLPHQFFGKTEIDQLVTVQQAVNILYNMIIANAMLAGNNQWMYEEGALLAEDVTNQPGLMIPVAQGAITGRKIERLTPAPISQDTYMLMREMENHGRADMAGVQDIMMGESKSGMSGVLANSLQAAALTRQSFKMLALDESYRRQARLEIYMIQQFYEFQDPRVNRQWGDGEWLLWSEGMRDLLWDVKVESQADLPHNTVARINYAIQLLQIGVYDIEEFLNTTGIHIRPELRSKIRQATGFNPMMQGEYGQAPTQQAMPQMPGAGQGLAPAPEGEAGMGGGLTGLAGLGQGVPEQAMPQM